MNNYVFAFCQGFLNDHIDNIMELECCGHRLCITSAPRPCPKCHKNWSIAYDGLVMSIETDIINVTPFHIQIIAADGCWMEFTFTGDDSHKHSPITHLTSPTKPVFNLN